MSKIVCNTYFIKHVELKEFFFFNNLNIYRFQYDFVWVLYKTSQIPAVRFVIHSAVEFLSHYFLIPHTSPMLTFILNQMAL